MLVKGVRGFVLGSLTIGQRSHDPRKSAPQLNVGLNVGDLRKTSDFISFRVRWQLA